MNSFQEMGLNPAIQTALDKLNFTNPTPIQAQTLPFTLQGKDILGSAQTGTGKTLAFTIPLISRLLENPSESALVLVPTRELAQQVAHMVRQLLGSKGPKIALLIGGEAFIKQLHQVRSKETRIIIGTPGRIIDHISRNVLKLDRMNFLVLDEIDRMLDMGFEKQIEQIVTQLPEIRQTLMFSATIPANILKTAARYLKNPERIAIGKESSPVQKIKQDVIFVADGEKEKILIEQLAECKESIIVFVKTKWNSENIAGKLTDAGFKAIALHGDLRQNKRERVVTAFRKGTYPILVATDIAARGIDIASVRHIINFDLPQNPEDYIHRIGRTARAGAEGFSLCLVTAKEKRNWMIIDRFANSSQGISDSDRASLSERPRRNKGGRGRESFGGNGPRGRSNRFGQNSGGRSGSGFNDNRERRGNRPRQSFDSIDGDDVVSFAQDRRPRFQSKDSERSFGRNKSNSFGSRPSFSGDRRRHSESSHDRPFFKRSRDDEGGNRRPFFKRSSDEANDRPFFKRDKGQSDREGGFASREERKFSPHSNNNRRSDDRPFFKRDGDFKKRSSFDPFLNTKKPFRKKRNEDGDTLPF